MNLDDMTPEQMEKAFKLCDVMSLEDLYVAAAILESYGWNLEKTLDEIAVTKQNQQKSATLASSENNQPFQVPEGLDQEVKRLSDQIYQQHSALPNTQNPNENKMMMDLNSGSVHNPSTSSVFAKGQNQYGSNYNYDDEDPYDFNNEDLGDGQVDYADYEYEYADSQLENKKKVFSDHYISEIPLSKTVSEPHKAMKELERDKVLASDYNRHRHQYQGTLLDRSEFLCEKILENDPSKRALYNTNKRKIQTNKKFIVYLHKAYKSRINFTFGTFLLNLIRSHLDDKYLLVFVHHENKSHNYKNIVERILTHPEISGFVNKHCVSYGMFDNSDDYEIVQKYLQMKDLPGFAIFKYDKKSRKEQFVSSYAVLSKEGENFLEWIAKNIGIALKKKASNTDLSSQKKLSEKAIQYERMSDLLKDQNWEYEEMEKLYKAKRQESKMNKEARKHKQEELKQKRKYFQQIEESELEEGKTIQIKFRMPISGESKLRVFSLSDKVGTMFDFIECFFQEEFEEPFCEFDLTQTFPNLSLKDKKSENLQEIFDGSPRQNIIVKEI